MQVHPIDAQKVDLWAPGLEPDLGLCREIGTVGWGGPTLMTPSNDTSSMGPSTL